MSKNNNEPAFPLVDAGASGSAVFGGLTKREFFTAVALHALIIEDALSMPAAASEAVTTADRVLKELETDQ